MPSMTMSAQEARDLLGLEPGYARSDLALAYRRVVRSVHPDLLAGSSEREVQDASDLLAQVNMANEILQRALRINASESWSVPEPEESSALWTEAPPASGRRGPRAADGRMVAVAIGIAVVVAAGFMAVVQLL